MKRIVSIWLNNFPLDRLKWQSRRTHARSIGQLSDETPFALTSRDARGTRIQASNDAAQRNGVHHDMRLTAARSLLPSLRTRPHEPEADTSALRRLAEWGRRYTPVVSVDGKDGLYLDITGAAHLCGGEKALLVDLAGRLKAIGFENRLGLARTPGAAWAIARFSEKDSLEERNITPSHIIHELHRLPAEALRLEADVLHVLGRLGLKTIGALCAIPRVSLKCRFPSREIGEAVLHRLDQVLGHAAEPIVPLRPVPVYCERLLFPEPVLATESFHLGLYDLLVQLAKHMEKDRKGATALTFSACHADGGASHITIATAQPSRDVSHLAYLFRDKIETINPGFGVDSFLLTADIVEQLEAEQSALSGGPKGSRDNKNLDQLIDRLSNRLGAQNVQWAVPRESHIPERAETRVPALQAARSEVLEKPQKPIRPCRIFDRPEPIQVMAEVPEGPPMQFTWRRVRHRIVRAEGPERIAPEWWCSKPGQPEQPRDYYRVEDEEGRRFWLFRTGLYCDAGQNRRPAWHMHGLFA
ncbi:MAG: Y-family DNA polymerase [Hyphomicrobiaceae bacterium]